jgi:DNA-binding response OmpR family regulator
VATRLNILVVEDHDDLRDMTVEVLNLQGHHAIGVPSAEALLDTFGPARQGDFSVPDLMIVDLNLPGEDGLSLARRVRLAQPSMGIIMVTARNQAADKVMGYESGADIYLPKPVAPDELVAAVNAWARRLGNATATLGVQDTTVARLQLNVRNLRLHGPLGKIDLSDTESALLVALMKAPGQRLVFWQLLELLGLGLDENGKTNLEIRFVRLRKKMVTGGAEKTCIRAIRLQGYQLCVALSTT